MCLKKIKIKYLKYIKKIENIKLGILIYACLHIGRSCYLLVKFYLIDRVFTLPLIWVVMVDKLSYDKVLDIVCKLNIT